jgi:uncharacterized protein (TIGR00255 family)
MTDRTGVVYSMSGFGRGAVEAAGVRVVCEIRTVNQRGLDISLSLPGTLLWADPLLRKMVSGAVHRGRVDLNLSVSSGRPLGGGALLDAALAARWAAELARLARRLRLERPRADALLAIPGVVRPQAMTPAPGRLTPLIRRAFDSAMKRLLVMRRREGSALAADLGRRFDRLERLSAGVRSDWPAAAARQQDRLTARLKEALERMGEERRSARDIVTALERGDVSEELTRIASHLVQCRGALEAGSPVGRQLEFLAAELQRETNTTGAKSMDAGITRGVVAMKEEVERIREQVANLE